MANAHDFIQRMRQVQAAREKAFEPLADILGKREDLQRQLAELDAPYGEAFAAAEAAGWTAEELKAIGAEEPVKRPKARARARRATAKKEATEASTAESAAAPPAAAVPAQEGVGEAATATAGSVSG
ncbi:hypothetical protein M1P56_35995 (plasmid) [Streptomyces sp. HU2014]|uniref:hypothetical protein n=1 Tax=Streptomyces sp. HU2014 TaxID=2939414 RepID=UPI00200D070A|nr:hypothetical protein [Streptomyces sp. HU2014]UQI49805.1 hypothetical protein M1P56_35995 [Streptomyces sp. HU2014]